MDALPPDPGWKWRLISAILISLAVTGMLAFLVVFLGTAIPGEWRGIQFLQLGIPFLMVFALWYFTWVRPTRSMRVFDQLARRGRARQREQ